MTVALLVALFHVALASAAPIDTALARALGVFGFSPSRAPITRADVDRYVDVLLILAEAARIGVEAEPAAVDAAWTAVAARVGGEAALTRWLEDQAIDRDWARHMVEEEVVRSRFLDARFAAFVFPNDEAVTRALGPGQHEDDARERVRDRLVREEAVAAQATWLDDARKRAS